MVKQEKAKKPRNFKFVLATDAGSTTSKARLFIYTKEECRFLGRSDLRLSGDYYGGVVFTLRIIWITGDRKSRLLYYLSDRIVAKNGLVSVYNCLLFIR